MKRTSIILATLLVSFALAGCGSNAGESAPQSDTPVSSEKVVAKVTVKFDYDGGQGPNDPASYVIDKGTSLADNNLAVPAPTKENCEFLGWFNGDTQLTADLKIKKDITFAARWDEHVVELDGHQIFFELGEHVTAKAYTDKTFANEDTANEMLTRNPDTGAYSKDYASFYFSLAFDNGYQVDSITFRAADGAWGGQINALTIAGKTNCYEVTRITSNGKVIVSAKN